MIVRVTGNGHVIVKQSNERRDGVAGLTRVTVAAIPFQNLESNVPRANPDVIRISNTEIEVAGIRTVRQQNAEMVVGNQAARLIPGHNPDKTQPHLAE